MRISQIEMLLLCAELGSIASAARRLNKSRSTVSTSLNALEDELGVTLLERTGNRVLLTDISRSILDDCDRILSSAGNIRARCCHHRQGHESILRIVRDDALPERFWRQVTTELKLQFPYTSFSMYVAPPPELAEFVESHLADIAFYTDFGWVEAEKQKQRYKKLGQVLFLLMAQKDHPLTQLQEVTRDDLGRYTEIVLTYMDDHSVKPLSPLSADYHGLPFFELMRDVAIDGLGWTSIPAPLIENRQQREALGVIKYPEAMSWHSYGAFMNPSLEQSDIVETLCQKVKNYLFRDFSQA